MLFTVEFAVLNTDSNVLRISSLNGVYGRKIPETISMMQIAICFPFVFLKVKNRAQQNKARAKN
jgi:hypothetical protein